MKTKLILIATLVLLPFGVSAQTYQSWTCDGEVYRIGPTGAEDVFSSLREGFAAASEGRIPLEQISLETTLSEAGGFSPLMHKTLNRRLKLKGFPDASLLNMATISENAPAVTMNDLIESLVETWSATYCRK